MFLDRDERLLLFHYRLPPFSLALESLKGFCQAGIKTAMLDACWASWHEVEPKPGVYNWDVADEVIDRQRQAGLKTILYLYHRAPDWVEGCVDIVRNEGTVNIAPEFVFPGTSYRAVNPFDADAMARETEYLRRVCERYSAADVLCCYAMSYGGERVLPERASPYTEQMCIDTVLTRQRVLAKYNDELWTMFHPHFAKAITGSIDRSTHPHVGNEHLWACYDAMRKEFPEHVLNQFVSQFFVFSPFRCAGEDVKVWVGAEYAAGVVGNAKRLPNHGLWGMVMGALWPGASSLGQPTPAVYAEVEKALEILDG